MNARTAAPAEHPAPHRDRAGAFTLAFAVAAAPLAWALQLTIGSGVASYACFPHDVPLATPLWAGVRTVLVVVGLVAALVAIGAGAVGWRVWQRSRTERPGSGHQVVESGDGRTRFVAMSGMITSGLFVAAIAFTTGMLMAVPLCHG